jgi:hypothetical protein
MVRYRLRNNQTIPRFVVVAMEYWAIAFAILIAIELTLSVCFDTFEVIDRMPKPLFLLLVLGGAFVGIGYVLLWMLMWVYWIKVERSSLVVRTGWFLCLFFGLNFGAIIYAFRVWATAIEKTKTGLGTLP